MGSETIYALFFGVCGLLSLFIVCLWGLIGCRTDNCFLYSSYKEQIFNCSSQHIIQGDSMKAWLKTSGGLFKVFENYGGFPSWFKVLFCSDLF